MMARSSSVLHLDANSLTEVDRVIVECSVEDFASSLEVWIRRPQVVNKRLLGAVVKDESSSERVSENGVPDKLISRQLIPKQSSIQWGWETIQLMDKNTVATFVSYERENGEWVLAYQFRFTTDEESGSSCIQLRLAHNTEGKQQSICEDTVISSILDSTTVPLLNATTSPPALLNSTNPLPNSTTNPSPSSITNPSPNSTTHPSPNSITNPSPNSTTNPSPNSTTNPLPNSTTNPSPSSITNPSTHSTTNSSPNATTVSLTNYTTVPSEEWLKGVLLPKLVKWCLESAQSTNSSSRSPHVGLVPLDRFASTYSRMKESYGKRLVENWSESTDPRKYVYEDIAIASYLITLWEGERDRLGLEKKQSFVDLGCGNGLLVHLLSSEGYPGKGIDLQKRKIWKLFQPQTILEERSIIPSDANLFPETDWLIGNHSDELTPWIPLMAARSSYTTKFFVLPCCPHDFVGRFARPSPHKSQYRCYLDYVAQIGSVVGFKVEEDSMRIPSNKRICFIGRERSYHPREEAKIEEERRIFLEERCKGKTPSLSGGETHIDEISESYELPESWCDHFKPRPQEAPRKNCTQVDPKLAHSIVTTVAEAILKAPLRHDGQMKVASDDTSEWSAGGGMPLEQVAGMFDSATLQHLKQEYGGLQTLLRNHHQVFEVISGQVCIRDWSLNQVPQRKKQKSMPKKPAKVFHKTKLCWFALHHPQGCPRTHEDCPYAHSNQELKSRPTFDHK